MRTIAAPEAQATQRAPPPSLRLGGASGDDPERRGHATLGITLPLVAGWVMADLNDEDTDEYAGCRLRAGQI